jgi:hypothetical protein
LTRSPWSLTTRSPAVPLRVALLRVALLQAALLRVVLPRAVARQAWAALGQALPRAAQARPKGVRPKGVHHRRAALGVSQPVVRAGADCPKLEVVVGAGMLDVELSFDPSREEVALSVSEDGSPATIPPPQPCKNSNLFGSLSAWSAGDANFLPSGVEEFEGELLLLRVDTSSGCVGGDVPTATSVTDQSIDLSGCDESLIRGLSVLAESFDPALVCAL